MSEDLYASEKWKEKTIKGRMETCFHFTGVSEKKCKVGIEYPHGPLPCIAPFKKDGVRPDCDKRELYTREQAVTYIEKINKSYERLVVAMAACQKDAKELGYGKKHGGVGKVPCPVCKTGTLHYSVASYNGHMHGKCSTKDCVSWMQ
jgi:hypothetical protein